MRFRYQNKHISLTIMLLLNFSVNCQIVDNIGNAITSPSQEVMFGSSLRLSQGTEMSHTGLQPISYSLFTISGNTVSHSVGISHYTGGVRPNDPVGDLGVNWSLHATGIIGRQIRGLCDFDKNHGYLQANASRKTTLASACTSGQSFCTSLEMNNSNAALVQYIDDIIAGSEDAYADLFTYSFGGYSGKFIFDLNGDILTFPRTNIKWECNWTTVTDDKAIEIIATTPDGTKYYFGGLNTEFTINGAYIERAININTPNDSYKPQKPEGITAWFLRKIVSRTAEEINFAYNEIPSFSGYEPLVELYTIDENYYSDLTINGTFSLMYKIFKSNYYTLQIKSISIANKSINFHFLNSRPDRDGFLLDNIEYQINSEVTKKVKFAYYDDIPNVTGTFHCIVVYEQEFHNQNLPLPKEVRRLWLKSFEITYANNGSVTSAQPEIYKFEYFNKYKLDIPQIMDIDEFGFQNKVRTDFSFFGSCSGNEYVPSVIPNSYIYNKRYISNKCLIPDGIPGSSTSLIRSILWPNGNSDIPDRGVSLEYVKLGSLTTIVLPTGGRVEYEYESNDYLENGVKKYGGGIRIKAIQQVHNDKVINRKEYYYVDDLGNSSGRLISKIQHNYRTKKMVNGASKDFMIYSGMPFTSLTGFYTGAMVSYSRIIEMQVGDNVAMGRKITYYNDEASNSDLCVQDASFVNSSSFVFGYPAMFPEFNLNDNVFCGLKKKVVYERLYNPASAMSAVFVKEKEVEYTYELQDATQITFGYFNGLADGFLNDKCAYLDRYGVKINNGWIRNIVTKETEYDGKEANLGNSITTTEKIIYSNPNICYPERQQTWFADGTVYEIYRKYIPSAIQTYGTNHYQFTLNRVGETYATKYLNNSLLSAKFVSGETFSFDNFGNILQHNVYEGPSSSTISYPPNNYAIRETMTYSTDGNHLLTVKGANQIQKKLLWRADCDMVAATITNSEILDYAFSSFDFTNEANWTFNVNKLTTGGYYKTGYNLTDDKITKGISNYGRYYVTFFCNKDYTNVSGVNLPFSFTIANGTVTVVNSFIEKVPLSTNENWYFYNFIINISGVGDLELHHTTYPNNPGDVIIDELRLFGYRSIMQTIHSSEGLGTTAEFDANSRATYYQFDAAGRVIVILDDTRKIIQFNKQHIKE